MINMIMFYFGFWNYFVKMWKSWEFWVGKIIMCYRQSLLVYVCDSLEGVYVKSKVGIGDLVYNVLVGKEDLFYWEMSQGLVV